MYCPNCGNENSAEQKFCRSCGLALEKIVQSLTEQLPTRKDATLAQRKERYERLGVAALSVFGFGVLSYFLYSVFNKLMISQGKVWAGLGVLTVLIVLGCGMLSVILFAKAKEVKEEAASKREIEHPADLTAEADTRELLPEAHAAPVFSVADRTTDLLAVKPVDDKKGS